MISNEAAVKKRPAAEAGITDTSTGKNDEGKSSPKKAPAMPAEPVMTGRLVKRVRGKPPQAYAIAWVMPAPPDEGWLPSSPSVPSE